MINEGKRLTELIETPRMGHVGYGKGMSCESVEGLAKLIEDADLKGKKMCEIGCFTGVSTETFLQFEPEKLYAVDLWGLNSGYDDGTVDLMNDRSLSWGEVEAEFRRMAENYDNVEIIKDYSANASQRFEDNSLDFLYIDGAHDFESVQKDIAAWLPKIKADGCIGGHDINNSGVTRAIMEFDELKNKEIKQYADTSWLIHLNMQITKPHPESLAAREQFGPMSLFRHLEKKQREE